MKNLTKIFMAVAVAMFAFACVTDTTEDLGIKVEGQGVTELALSLEESRTHLGEKAEGVYPLYWSEGDVIAVNGTASNPLAVDGDAANAVFQFGEAVAYPFNVVYPAVEGELNAVEFPATQEYAVGNIANGVAPMYGYSVEPAEGEAATPIQMNHLAGILRFAVKGNGEALKSLTVQAESGVLSGIFTVDCTSGALTAKEGSTSNAVSMTFGEGVTLSSEATLLHVAVPAGEYGALKIVLTTTEDKAMTLLLNTAGARAVEAGVVREFREFAFAENDVEREWFEIYTPADLLNFAKNHAVLPVTKGAKLMATIDMTDIEWTPIDGFSKIFDGNRDADYEISGLNAPLFGTTSATIKNLNINVNIETDSSSYYDSTAKVLTLGGIACIAEGPISDCTVSGKVAWAKRASNGYTYTFVGGAVGQAKEGASFTNVKNEADISTTKANNTTFLGGIVAMAGINGGTFSITVTNCENTGDVTVEEKNYSGETNRNSYIGGVVGSTFVNLTITGCKNSGAVTHNDAYTKNAYVGGIFGVQYTVMNISINNCENTGAVYVNTACREHAYIGGVIGSLKTNNYEGVNVSNLKNSGSVTIEGNDIQRSVYTGGVCGEFVNNTDDTSIDAQNWYNTGAVTMNAGGNQALTTNTCYFGGVFGSATRTAIINCDNAGSVIYGEDSKFGKASANTDLFIGGIGGYRVTGKVENCDNSGTIYLRAENNSFHHQIGGLFGQVNAYGAGIRNCTNGGNIEAESTFGPKRCRLGGLFGLLYYTNTANCVNSGNINYNAKETSNQMYIGGAVGYAYASTSGNMQIATLSNKGKITINKGTEGPTAQICVAGIIGSMQKVYTDASYVKDCVNIGDIEMNLPTTFTGVDIGGIIAHHGNITNTNIVFSGHKQYSTIKAMGRTLNDIGTIKGINSVAVLVATNCSAGGAIEISTSVIEDEYSGAPEEISIPGAINQSNWHNYIYAGGVYPITDDNTYGGCSLLETKPVVNVVTTPQPAAK